MGNKINDPIARLMGLRYKSHPWHGLEVGDSAPEAVTAFIEMVPTDTVKYELDKVSGYIRIDRPQKYSTVVPALYGFIPQSFCGDSVARFCMDKCCREGIRGDGDPLDVLVGVGSEDASGTGNKEAIVTDGKEYLLERPIRADVACIYGSVADKYGNVKIHGTARNFNTVMATAADTVICQADEVVDMIDPDEVLIQGVLVDYIVGGKN